MSLRYEYMPKNAGRNWKKVEVGPNLEGLLVGELTTTLSEDESAPDEKASTRACAAKRKRSLVDFVSRAGPARACKRQKDGDGRKAKEKTMGPPSSTGSSVKAPASSATGRQGVADETHDMSQVVGARKTICRDLISCCVLTLSRRTETLGLQRRRNCCRQCDALRGCRAPREGNQQPLLLCSLACKGLPRTAIWPGLE